MLRRLLALLRPTRGPLAARVNAPTERERVLALLNRRVEGGAGVTLTWRVWRRKIEMGLRANGGNPKAPAARHR